MLMQRVDRPLTPERRARPRWRIRPGVGAMVLRCATALIGGYVAMSAVATFVARILPIARVEATVWASIPAFLYYAVLGLWCFHEPRLTRVVAVVWGSALLAGGAIWWLGVRP